VETDSVGLVKVENFSFETQKRLEKVILTEKGAESASEFESDVEDLPVDQEEKEEGSLGFYKKRKDRIFQYIRVQDSSVSVPDLAKGEQNKLTVFLELDDILLHSFVCDQNFGFLSQAVSKDPEHEFFLEEIRQPVVVFMRDYWEEFMKYLRESKGEIDTIVYSTAIAPYTKKLIDILDPKREVFRTLISQNGCYIFENKEEDILYLLKDISQFKNRDMKRSILVDSQPTNFILTPENVLPAIKYNGESSSDPKAPKDPFLLQLIDELEGLKAMDDVRGHLKERFKIRRTLKNSKLI